MQVIRLNTWHSAEEVISIIELLDALREALVQEHYEGIVEIMRDNPNRSSIDCVAGGIQLELPIEGEIPSF